MFQSLSSQWSCNRAEEIATKAKEYRSTMDPEERRRILQEYPNLQGMDALIKSVNNQVKKNRETYRGFETRNQDSPQAVQMLNRMRETEDKLYERAVKRAVDFGYEKFLY